MLSKRYLHDAGQDEQRQGVGEPQVPEPLETVVDGQHVHREHEQVEQADEHVQHDDHAKVEVQRALVRRTRSALAPGAVQPPQQNQQQEVRENTWLKVLDRNFIQRHMKLACLVLV